MSVAERDPPLPVPGDPDAALNMLDGRENDEEGVSEPGRESVPNDDDLFEELSHLPFEGEWYALAMVWASSKMAEIGCRLFPEPGGREKVRMIG